ncbi:MAG: alcohol dehydrogenase [Clostridiales bacterium GWC2_40_7]|nr:MAG: alcohol dehydrogenase [Clostridiales bacterium GWC2_40_7]
MEFNYNIGTKVIFGKDCIRQNGQALSDLGKKALIVTGRKSARESGALDDVCVTLSGQGTEFVIYDRVENNPSLDNVGEGGRIAREYKADFVIGIGGGSPLDAAKAIAVLAANDMEPIELYSNNYRCNPVPIIAVPTAAGTGSEVTPYSILTRSDRQTKMSFGNDTTFPKIAFMDAGYTESLPWEVTVNTAVDALSHAVEGYLSKKSTPVSDIFAIEAIKSFGECLSSLIGNRINPDIREKLLYAAMLAGMVITHTGTTIVHGMGYNLTYFMGIPHGKANGFLMKEYFKFNYDYARDKTDRIFQLLNISTADEFGSIIDSLMPGRPKLSQEEVEKYSFITMQQRSTSNNQREVKKSDIEDIFLKVFG